MNEAEAWIISGIPGSGKTTVGRLLAKKFPRGVHLEGDLVGHHFIVTGLVAPNEEPQEEAHQQLALRRRNINLLANSFLEAGFSVVIDDVVVSAAVLQQYSQNLSAPIRFVQLGPSIEVVEARDAGRHKQVFHIWKHLQRELDQMEHVGLWLDTSTMSAEDTVESILEKSDEAILGEHMI